MTSAPIDLHSTEGFQAEILNKAFTLPMTDGIDLLPRKPGIYGMWNRATRLWNVGQSDNIYTRCLGHRSQIKAGAAANMRIRRDALLSGADSFFYLTLELVAEGSKTLQRDLKLLEVWWAVQLQAHDERYGYNAEAGGHRTPAARFRDRERKLMRRNSEKYQLLPGTDLYQPINPVLLSSWVPGS